jgi:hypothetical protein
MKCPTCGREIGRTNRFCAGCGAPVSSRTLTARPNHRMLAGIGAFLFLAVGFGLAQLRGSSAAHPPWNGAAPARLPAQARPVDSTVLAIAEQFDCPCGTCRDPLATCACEQQNGAVEVKQFIAHKLAEGHPKSHIVELVNQKYGGLKEAGSRAAIPERILCIGGKT